MYLPKHTSWLNQIEIVFGVVMRKVIRRGSFTSTADLKDKLTRFIGTSTGFASLSWTFTGAPAQANRETVRASAVQRITIRY